MPTPITRSVGIMLLAVGLILGSLGLAPAYAAPSAARPQVTLTAAAQSVVLGERATLTGAARKAAPRQRVVLQQRERGRWVRVAAKRLSAKGATKRFSFQPRPTAVGVATYRVTLLRTGRYAGVSSRPVQVRVDAPTPTPTPNPTPPPTDKPTSPNPPAEPPGPPTLTGFTPLSGDVAGGEQLTVSGTGLAVIDEVRLGAGPAELVSASATSVVVRTPAHAAGPVSIDLLTDGEVVATSAGTYEYVVPVLDSVDEFTPAAGSIVLEPEAVASVAELPSGGYEVELQDPDPRFAAGTRFYLRPGHTDAWSGLMAEVDEVAEPEDPEAGPTLIVHQVAADQVLDEWDLQQTVALGAVPGGEDAADGVRGGRELSPAAARTALATAGAAPTNLANFNRSFLDCRKKVEEDDGEIRWEPVPTGGPQFQVKFTIDDLQVNVKDHKRGSQQYYEASLTGKPKLEVIGKVEYAAKCDLMPQVTDRFQVTIPTPSGIELKIKPDVSVTFDAAGKIVASKQFSFFHGIRKIGDGPVTPTNQVTAQPAEAETSLSASVSIRAGLDASVTYRGFIGLGVKAGPKVTLEATYDVDDNTTCVTLGFGIEAELYAELKALFFEWEQPLLPPFELDIADESWCTENPEDPNTDLVLDPDLPEYSEHSYVVMPTHWGDTPFPPGTFEPLNYGDAYILRADLTLEPGNYYLHRPLYIPEGVSLTVPAGAHLKAGHCYWTIHLSSQPCINLTGGALYMNGTKSDPIIVTRYADDTVDGDTDGVTPQQSLAGVRPFAISAGVARVTDVQFRQNTGLSQGGGNLNVERSTFRSGATLDAQAWDGVLRLTGTVVEETAPSLHTATLTVERSRFDNSASVGAITTGRFSGNTVRHGLNVAGKVSVVGNHFVDTAVEMSTSAATDLPALLNNTTDDGEQFTVQLSAGTLDGSVTWRDATYVVSGYVSVPEGRSLTFTDGAVLKVASCGNGYSTSYSCLNVAGTLRLTEGAVITSVTDGTIGGDSHLSGQFELFRPPTITETAHLDVVDSEVRPSWGQWQLPTGSTATVEGSRWIVDGMSGIVSSASDLAVADSELSQPDPAGRPYALSVVGGSASITGSTFRNVGLAAGTPITVHGNDFASGTLQNTGTSLTLNATGNWWGSSAGPALSGPGQQVIGAVAVDPWCTTAACH